MPEFTIEHIDILQLHPNVDNPRKIKDPAFIKLKDSISSFPEMLEIRPVVYYVNSTGQNVVIGGNMRLRAAFELGWEFVPAINVTKLPEERRREFVIKDNASAGEWDEDKLLDAWDLEELKKWALDFDHLTNFEQQFNALDNSNCEMPIVPRFNEKYGAVIIVLSNESEIAMAETLLQLEPEKCYKSDHVGKSFVITMEKLLRVWKS